MADSYPRVSFRIPESMRDELKLLAAKQEVSVTKLIISAITNFVRQNQPAKPEKPTTGKCRFRIPSVTMDAVVMALIRQGMYFEPEDILVLTCTITERVKVQQAIFSNQSPKEHKCPEKQKHRY